MTAALAILLGWPAEAAFAQQRFALIVSGASGGAEYAAQYATWTDTLQRTLTQRMAFDPARVTVLSETDNVERAATAGNIRRVLASIRQQMGRDDLLFLLLVGHGTFDGVDAKFNLVGPDLEAADWAALLESLQGQVVVVNTTAGSFPFIERLSGPKRIVITATDSIAQRFDTVFAEYFVKAFDDDSADLDKNARVSVWEAFASAAAGVRRHYQQRGQLSTERSLLDDNADRLGTPAAEQGGDGALASRTYLDREKPGAAPTDEALLRLLQRKALLEAELEELKVRKSFLPAEEYAREFERIITEYARVSSDIRKRTPGSSTMAGVDSLSRIRRLVALIALAAMAPVGQAVVACDGWSASAAQRMACCRSHDGCAAVSADDCCAHGETRQNLETVTATPVSPGDTSFERVAAPARPIRSTRVALRPMAERRGTYLLDSVFLI